MGFTGTAEFTELQYQDSLDASEEDINEETNTVFVDGTLATPAYTQVLDETHTGKGYNDKRYWLKKYPLPDVSTTVSGTAVGTADTTIYVVSTNGFPSSGYINIGTDKITYTGKSTTSFTGCTGISAAHGTATTVSPFVIEISTTTEGQTPTWTVMEHDIDCFIDKNTGTITLNDSSMDVSSQVAFSRFPEYQTANRLRASYISGVSTIPKDIERLCIKMAARDLRHSVVNKAHAQGNDGFSPEPITIDDKWIEHKLKKYRKYRQQLI